jgi:hypothetical protein
MRAARRLTGLVACSGLAACVAAAPARPEIKEYPVNPSATPLGRAMEAAPGLVRRGVFSALPPSSKPAAVSTTRLAGFPRRGSSFAILSSGNARYADDPNDEGDLGTQARGPSIRGARDVAIMRLDVRIPRGVNCLSFDFRYLSEEFPEFVDDQFNDAFIAELGSSDWDASSKINPTIRAPSNFAINRRGDPIRVNALGNIGVSAARARGTTYDAATRLLRASTRVRPGLGRLYLSIFDQGDRIYDSAVFLDNLRVAQRERCRPGIAKVPS